MPEPQKFQIGLIELFSVWLPGALLTYVMQWDVRPCLEAFGYPMPQPGVESWAVFLFVSYLTGHFIFVLASMLLDPLADHIRKAGKNDWKLVEERYPKWGRKRTETAFEAKRSDAWKKRRPKSRSQLLRERFWKRFEPVSRWLSGLLFDQKDWEALDQVWVLRRRHLSRIRANAAMSCFEWSKVRLTLGHPEALAAVERFEADSKFFRSLCIVLALLVPWGLLSCRWLLAAGALVLVPGALWRFIELRRKSVSQAYWFVIGLETDPPPPPQETPGSTPVQAPPAGSPLSTPRPARGSRHTQPPPAPAPPRTPAS
jgi:hypothetical protein